MAHGFKPVFAKLKTILKPYANHCEVEQETEGDYFLNLKTLDENTKPVFFAGVSMNKISVSFYVPVFRFPSLRKQISPKLAKQLHGKSCFRFTSVDTAVMEELRALTGKVRDLLTNY